MHIGGGESLLHPDGLSRVLERMRKTGMGLDYVETNAAWFRGEESAAALNTCDPCAEIRIFLVHSGYADSGELRPTEFYARKKTWHCILKATPTDTPRADPDRGRAAWGLVSA